MREYGERREQSWQWWMLEEGDEEIARSIRRMREQIKTRDQTRRQDLAAMRAQYLDQPCEYYERLAYHRSRASRYNLTQGSVDGVHAQIVTNRVRPRVSTTNGSHEQRRKAKKRQIWIDGTFDEIDAQELISEMALDAEQYGTGVLWVYPEDGRPAVSNVFPGDVWVDPREERTLRRKVRTFYLTQRVERCVLQAQYPEHHEALEEVPGEAEVEHLFADIDDGAEWSSPHQLEVVEAWRLPVCRDAKCGEPGCGRHVIVCGSVVLLDEPWTIKRPPLVFFHWSPAGRFWGQGLVERSAGMQSDLNTLTETIQETYGAFPPQLWVDEGAGVETTSLNDTLGKINRCKPVNGDVRTAVAVISGDVSPNLLGREQTIADRFMRTLGVDSLGAQAEKPAGLNSGEALRNFKDFTSQRFLPQQRRLERAACDLAELLFYFGEQLAKAGYPQEVFGSSGRGRGFEAVDLGGYLAHPDERFVVQIKPGSALPRDVSGKIQTILDMQAAGLQIDAVQLAELLDMPDTDALLERIAGGRELVRDAMDLCYDVDEPQPVAHSFWPRAWALGELVTEIQVAEVHGASEEQLERLRNLHGHLLSLPDPNAPPPATPVPAPGPAAGPPMMPGAPPPMPTMPPPGGAPPGAPIQ